MMPVRSEDRSYVAKPGEVQLRDEHGRYAVQRGSAPPGPRGASRPDEKEGAGMTMQAPCEVAARLPITMPKQW